MAESWTTIIISFIVTNVNNIINFFLHKSRENAEIEKVKAETQKINIEYETSDKSNKMLEGLFIEEKPLQPIIRKLATVPKSLWDGKSWEHSASFPLIESTMLGWKKATIIFWMEIPQDGKGYRAKREKKPQDYILRQFSIIFYQNVHQNARKNHEETVNKFHFGYSNWANSWYLTVSNTSGIEKSLTMTNDIEPGWHQFVITWSQEKQTMELFIDQGISKDFLFLNDKEMKRCWPKSRDTCIDIQNIPYLYYIEIYDDYMHHNRIEIKNHYAHRPEQVISYGSESNLLTNN